ncbi:helix-turn-helix domain-containing protein [Skermania sp. ID1734]|uniref:helix-turn-helix domain-containing protein n=1 Tax=Skermania sp. ID1734 TaxID=2597516 RepID=UPI0011812D0F|nr:helix-turn-helix domain-containing protein [Skermania sp. ID1734]TSE01964.1 helix-turn-helix domain-containing protein [Skermania sp. ID1734]
MVSETGTAGKSDAPHTRIDNRLLEQLKRVGNKEAEQAELRLSHGAFRLFVVLSRHIDNETRQCFPSWDTLRRGMGLKSDTSIGTYLDELIEAGLLVKQQRWETAEGKRHGLDVSDVETSQHRIRYQNLYTVHRYAAVNGGTPDVAGTGTPDIAGTGTPPDGGVTRPTELDPQEPNPDSELHSAAPPRPRPSADDATKTPKLKIPDDLDTNDESRVYEFLYRVLGVLDYDEDAMYDNFIFGDDGEISRAGIHRFYNAVMKMRRGEPLNTARKPRSSKRAKQSGTAQVQAILDSERHYVYTRTFKALQPTEPTVSLDEMIVLVDEFRNALRAESPEWVATHAATFRTLITQRFGQAHLGKWRFGEGDNSQSLTEHFLEVLDDLSKSTEVAAA